MAQDQQSPRRFGDYFLLKKIAAGGMAEIFLAKTRTAQGPEKYVALKMIHPRYLEERNFHQMIVEEAKIAVQLGHRNVGQVFDLGQVDGRYFLVMEYIDGYDLSRLHDVCEAKRLPIPFEVVAFVGREVCAALSYAHKLRDRAGTPLNLIHRDISPQNILLSFQGDVKIIDFGIAKVATQMQQTQVGVIKGKFYYMSPEQAGAHDIDQRSDLFSLGICLWESLCGRSLFRREGGPTNPLAILHQIRSMPIPRVSEIRPDCPPELDELIARALARDLTARFASADAMMAGFNRFISGYYPRMGGASLASFLKSAWDKTETTKETDRITTQMADLMQRRDFKPTTDSVIFELHGVQNHSATQLLQELDERRPSPTENTAGVVAGVADSSSGSKHPNHLTTSKGIQKISDEHLAMSDTVYLRKDDVEEMRRAGAAPLVLSNAETNSVTLALSRAEIQAARAAFTPAPAASPTPPSTPTREPISGHPLFRWLVIAVLVLCILSATLALMLIKRSRQREQLQDQQQQLLESQNTSWQESLGTP